MSIDNRQWSGGWDKAAKLGLGIGKNRKHGRIFCKMFDNSMRI